MHLKPPITATILILLLSCSAHGQYRRSMQDYYMAKSIGSGRAWKRISIGVGKFYIPATVTLKYKGYDPKYSISYDTTIKEHTRSKESWTVHAGTFLPISMISDNSMITVNIEFVARGVSLSYDSLHFIGTGKFMYPVPAYMAGLPISFEYKKGGEVSLDKKDKTLFTLAAGFVPCVVNSNNYNLIKPYKFIPFIKAEIGIMMGIAVKLRGTAYLGKTKYIEGTYFNSNNIGAYDEFHASADGSNGYSISLIIMPFSWAWDAGF